MTSLSPTIVAYEFDADVRTGTGWVPLPVVTIDPSIDRDRRAYTGATLTLDPIDRDTFTLLDPRIVTPSDVGQVRWRIRQVDPAGTILGYLPRVGATTGDYAIMHVRTITRTIRDVRIELYGRELLAADKLNLSPNRAAVVAYTGTGFLEWLLTQAFGAGEVTDHTTSSVLADKPWWPYVNVNDSYLDTIETELNSLDARLLDLWGTGWHVSDRATPPTYTGAPTVVKLGAYTTDATHTLPADVDPIIVEVEDVITRDSDWADAVVVRGEARAAEYVTTWQHLAQQTNHTKGRVIEVDRGEPSGNLAESIASRTIIRGRDLRVNARARFDVLPGMELQAHLRGETLSAQVKSVDWDLTAGTMSIHAESAVTVPVIEETDKHTSQAVTPVYAVNAVQNLATSIRPTLNDARAAKERQDRLAVELAGIYL